MIPCFPAFGRAGSNNDLRTSSTVHERRQPGCARHRRGCVRPLGSTQRDPLGQARTGPGKAPGWGGCLRRISRCADAAHAGSLEREKAVPVRMRLSGLKGRFVRLRRTRASIAATGAADGLSRSSMSERWKWSGNAWKARKSIGPVSGSSIGRRSTARLAEAGLRRRPPRMACNGTICRRGSIRAHWWRRWRLLYGCMASCAKGSG